MQACRQVLFVQGGGAAVHDEWDHRLVASLQRRLGDDYEIRYPRMPNEDDPSYETWKNALEKEFSLLNEGAILVGHSVGGTILINALADSATGRHFGAIFLLAAPFVGDGGWPGDDLQTAADLGASLPRDVPIHIYHGLADGVVPPAHAELYTCAIPQAHIHRLPSGDHQFNDDLREVAAAIRSITAGS